ncbi:acyltransferase [Pediococcus acidilactici]|uniref:acyltransferase n=1 Tax=Pediococcus acidilactici TaxID=1254 RepID=UPI00140F60FF|nr:acyltransferase family protein [Pediococcus acidilactici]QIO84970.1 acyltransferase family protein [Pediococcus acidilactici]QJW86459.1 acyltransferase family protein [Pediococcus acidilactici]QYI95304.1 acyltransferase family protein [Pediococcus acidilactici]
MSSSRKRIIGIDLVKVIACFSVILLHASMPFFYSNQTFKIGNFSIISEILYYAGTAAVPLFFMTNGFFLINRSKMSYRYIYTKIGLILVPVFGWNAILYLTKLLLGKNQENYLIIVGKSFLQRGFFFQFWFLGALIIMLLLVPIFNSIIKRSIKLFSVIMLLCLLISWGFDLYNHFSGQMPIQKSVIQTFRLWTWNSYYMAGGLIGFYYRRDGFSKIKKWIGYVLGITSVLMLIYSILNLRLVKTPFAEYNYDNVLIFFWINFIFLCCVFIPRFSTTQTKIIESISKYSFGIYIVHVIVLKIFEKFLGTSCIFINLVTIIGVFASSWIITYVMAKIPYLNKLVVF